MPQEQRAFDRVAKHITADPPDEEFRAIVKQISTEDIEEFLLVQTFKYAAERIAVLKLELKRRTEAQALKRTKVSKWQDRAWGLVAGILITLLTQYVSN